MTIWDPTYQQQEEKLIDYAFASNRKTFLIIIIDKQDLMIAIL
jgi:hypothetical protein